MCRKRLRPAALLLAISFGLTANAQRTPGQQAYFEGYTSSDPGVVEQKMRIAIRDDPSEGLSKVPGAGKDSLGGKEGAKLDYFPHARLGLALVKTGKKEEALKELRESIRQKAVLSKPSLLKQQVEANLAQLEAEFAPVVPPTSVPTILPTVSAPFPTAAQVVTPTAVIPSAATNPSTAPGATSFPTPKPKDEREAVRAGIKLYFEGSYDLAEKQLTPLTSQVARLFLAYTLATESLLLSKDLARSAEAQRKMAEALKAYEAGLVTERPNDPNIPRKVLDALRSR